MRASMPAIGDAAAMDIRGLTRAFAAVFAITLLAACSGVAARQALPVAASASMPEDAEAAGLVDVRAFVPDAELDIRYAGTRNFVGTRVEGYDAARCWLHRPVAEALANVAADLRQQQMKLRIFDCYRPARAVAHFMRWAKDMDDQRTKPEFYPKLEKGALVGEYIAEKSGHSRGATIDLSLMQCDARGENCRDLDMGTPFDFFDTRANTDDPRMTPQQRGNRDRLREAMQRHGFANYPMEWWHFAFKPEPTPNTFFDIVLE